MRTTVSLLIAAVLGGSSVFALQACTSESGATPQCQDDYTNDAGEAGPNKALLDAGADAAFRDGCNPFAVCTGPDGGPQPVEECCKGFDKKTQSLDYQLCLYGYGAALPPNLGAGGGGGSTGSGGAGGGDGGP